jgi:hypothetical protein
MLSLPTVIVIVVDSNILQALRYAINSFIPWTEGNLKELQPLCLVIGVRILPSTSCMQSKNATHLIVTLDVTLLIIIIIIMMLVNNLQREEET